MDEDEINLDPGIPLKSEEDPLSTYVDPVKQAQATALLADQMRREEEALHQQYLTGPGSGVLPMGSPRPAIAPVQGQFGQVMPTSRGFMYVGNPTPGTAEELPGTVASRLAAATAPQHVYGQPEVTSIDPTMQQFAVQERVRGAVAKGMPLSDAMLLYGMGSVGRIPAPKRYQVHGVGLVDEAGRVIAKENRAARMNVPGVGLVDVSSGQVVVPSRQTTSPALLNRHRALVADLTVIR